MPKKNVNTKEFLLDEILKITKEGLVYANQCNVDKLSEVIKKREDYIVSLLELCKKEKLSGEEIKLFDTIGKETVLLMEKMETCVKKLSNELASLYNGKQVVKYI